MKKKYVIVTGGCGFIGSYFVKKLLNLNYNLINIDKLTYAANKNLNNQFLKKKNYKFFKIDISKKKKLNTIFQKYKPYLVFNFAAESHVDNSITNPKNFINTNIIGTYNLISETKKLHDNGNKIKFIQISTDEVYGDIIKNKTTSKESDPYRPSSPYSASKASADHLVRAWCRTFKINYNITCSSNNFGPFQNKEKFIPVIINSFKNKRIVPVYGQGNQKRNWIYVEDNVEAIFKVGLKGKKNTTYNIGSHVTLTNLDLLHKIKNILIKNYKFNPKIDNLITFVKDRPGHDLKYEVNFSRIRRDLNWKAKTKIRNGLMKTISWYLDN